MFFKKKYLLYLFRTSPGAKFLSDPQWITNAGNHLFQHVQIFLGMVLHSQVTVRQALQRMCSKLQKYSWKSLGNTRVLQVRILYIIFRALFPITNYSFANNHFLIPTFPYLYKTWRNIYVIFKQLIFGLLFCF